MRTPKHATSTDRNLQRAALAAVLLLALVTLASGLTGCTPAGGVDLRKILATWDDVCHTGRGALVVAAQITHEPVDAGAGDASASAESDGGTEQ